MSKKEKKPSVSAVDKVVSSITDEIINKSLHPGDRLEPEEKLASKYNVGRNSVREAIKQLQAYGVLYIKRADGTYIEDSFNTKMLDPLLYSLIFCNKDEEDLAQLRAIIETGILQNAMQDDNISKVIPHLIELTEETERELNKETPDPGRVLDIDLKFHSAIAGTMGNPQVDILTSYITRMTVPARRKAVEEWIRYGKQDEFIRLHRDIIDVMEKRDFSRINQVVNNHYIFLRKVLKND